MLVLGLVWADESSCVKLTWMSQNKSDIELLQHTTLILSKHCQNIHGAFVYLEKTLKAYAGSLMHMILDLLCKVKQGCFTGCANLIFSAQ